MLIQLIVVLVVLGLILWIVETFIPLDATIKKLIQVVVLIACLLIVLQAFGIVGSHTPAGRLLW